MSYHYQSINETITSDGYETKTSIIIHEISEAEASSLCVEEKSQYEVLDEDQLTEYDFLALEEEDETESESDIEYYWFPSLMRNSIIEFLSDDDESLVSDDASEAIVEEEKEDDLDENVYITSHGKRSPRFRYQQNKRVKRDQVPVEVIHIVL
ncbi:hypothetical protein CU097_012856 [Rhizopus azygosporus]|uniref:Uncharacterized protein n=1 Tax=Rhizopus azygosporus TaxID=86630 RepID=A0A367K0T6_RHIAZ|nr:hypothetical protein CU097_012856 [Rhizopus azygosporus]